jgi:uncharacterized protein YkwD
LSLRPVLSLRLSLSLRPALALILALAAAPAVACVLPGNLASLQAAVVGNVNAERAQSGLPALHSSGALMEAAQRHACDNAGRNKMSHKGSNGSNVGQRARNAGYSWRLVNENVAAGHRGPDSVVEGWMSSRPHRVNILARGTRSIGVGLAFSASGKPHWVMVSAAPR